MNENAIAALAVLLVAALGLVVLLQGGETTGMVSAGCESYCVEKFDLCHESADRDWRREHACYLEFRDCMDACRATA
jgi:hypothetical protein